MEEIGEDLSTIVLGVDTHLDVHVGVVVDQLGRVRGSRSIPVTSDGYADLLNWARGMGSLARAGLEGTGTYGAGLARFLSDQGIQVIEVNRPDRARRRRRGKNDPTDAESAARAVLAGDAVATPKARSGFVEAMRAVNVARRSAVKAKTQAANQLRGLLVSAPALLRETLLKAKIEDCVSACSTVEDNSDDPAVEALKATLRLLARRWVALHAELRQLDTMLDRLTRQAAPRLTAQFGVGPQTAATLLMTAGDNPQRLRSEAALAALCGVSPLEASSGKVTRHRLNRGGARQANNALWTISMVRMRSDERTKAYVERRTREGRTRKEIQRCLKRYIVRELYPLILADLAQSASPS